MLLCHCSDNNKYDKVLQDYSYYVSLNIAYDKHIIRIVIENADLFYILKKEQEGFTQSKYERKVTKVLNQNIPLIVDKNTFFLLEKYQVIPTEKIDKLKKKGINNIRTSLFNKYGALTAPLSEMDEKYVIDILFQNKIFTLIDCETGYIYSPSFNQNNK